MSSYMFVSSVLGTLQFDARIHLGSRMNWLDWFLTVTSTPLLWTWSLGTDLKEGLQILLLNTKADSILFSVKVTVPETPGWIYYITKQSCRWTVTWLISEASSYFTILPTFCYRIFKSYYFSVLWWGQRGSKENETQRCHIHATSLLLVSSPPFSVPELVSQPHRSTVLSCPQLVCLHPPTDRVSKVTVGASQQI